MARQRISNDLKRFIKEHIHSVYALETLLLLHRNQERAFTPNDVARELGFEEDIVHDQFLSLVSLRLAAKTDVTENTYSYLPADDDLRALVDGLAWAYSKHRVPILSLILADRSDRIRLFAEAFRVIRGSD